ncbi:class I SAM-dependent methyltransferase [Pseudonocardia nigra]|uniref:class I SAM-dependent methyltransferase n=1 Tax=Pseudonocardia nigra TaxID=1921578 RepID=UPI001C607300|nr:class I SAM-dependent methyltransferase [Pseudonocardia nigra]
MATRDRERWDERHAAAGETVPAPPDALRGREDLLPAAGCALDVACGRGAVSVWLAGRGLHVDAVDASAVAIAHGSTLAGRNGAAERVRWWRHDLDAGLPAACAGPYDVVVCQRFRDPALYAQLADRLRPGGLLVVTVLSEVGARPGPWRAAAGELASAFAALEVLVQAEGDGEASLVARRPVSGPGSAPAARR